MNVVSDDDLMRLYLDGDEAAFHVLYDRHRTGVYRFARLMLNDAGKAEDVLQETFLAVARAAGRYVPRGQFRAWLMRIARNRCLNWLEAERARRAFVQDGGLEFLGSREPASGDCSPAEQVDAADRMARVRKAINAFNEPYSQEAIHSNGLEWTKHAVHPGQLKHSKPLSGVL